MSCPHVNQYEDCPDCPDYPCELVTPAVADAMLDQAKPALPDCEQCPLMRLVADFIRRFSEEQAWMSGDAVPWHELQHAEEER